MLMTSTMTVVPQALLFTCDNDYYSNEQII